MHSHSYAARLLTIIVQHRNRLPAYLPLPASAERITYTSICPIHAWKWYTKGYIRIKHIIITLQDYIFMKRKHTQKQRQVKFF